jgi:hypothetical protein
MNNLHFSDIPIFLDRSVGNDAVSLDLETSESAHTDFPIETSLEEKAKSE